MSEPNLTPAELIELHDPTPEAPEPLRLPREAWVHLIQTGYADTADHIYIWSADGVCRLSKVWIGHPDLWKHWQDLIVFGGDPG